MSEPDYPIHSLIWANSHSTLPNILGSLPKPDLEVKDPHGRTPLMLAVSLGQVECTRQLLDAGANVNTECDGWTVVQEATATGDQELVQMVLDQRDRQRYSTRIGGIPDLLKKLKDAPDFYVEMTWEFTSWVPLVSRMCPSDTYRVYKRGSSVRVDTTLLGFDQNSWVRGSRSYIFTGTSQGAKFYEIDHDTKQVYIEEMGIEPDVESLKFSTQEQVQHRLSTPLIQTFLDTENISFQRAKGGIFGWGGEKTELVSGMDCKVFGANNVEIVTKTRTEHMSAEDKLRAKANKNPLLSFFGPQETEATDPQTPPPEPSSCSSPTPKCQKTFTEYLSSHSTLRSKEECNKSQKFRAHLWLCEDYPLSLQEQVMPIVDLLAISNTHFQKLKHFIHMQLPSGFPVKIEIPLFHVINARITFSNIQALDTPVPGVTSFKEDDGRSSAAIDDSVFEVPRSYDVLGGASENTMRQYQGTDEEEIMLQYAIRQSLGEPGDTNGETADHVDIWEALEGLPPGQSRVNFQGEDRMLQQAIEASMSEVRGQEVGVREVVLGEREEPEGEDELAVALRISQEQEAERQDRIRKEEEEMIRQVMELSLREK
eukprot:GFUD01072052.1.p1 GENE.GFUD01072052.1~~GFUD01072052.1.p1  ORF type:complete len:597 (-),score=183.28 GFUD01072052.1:517-2307(-)